VPQCPIAGDANVVERLVIIRRWCSLINTGGGYGAFGNWRTDGGEE